MSTETLGVSYLIYGFDRKLYDRPPHWENCVFEQKDNYDVLLHINQIVEINNLDVESTIGLADGRVRQLMVAWELRYGRKLNLRRFNISLPSHTERDWSITLRSGLALGDKATAHYIPGSPPAEMPQAPIMADRWAQTLAEANDLTNYVEEQLRRNYLIIEELWELHKHEFSTEDHEKQQEIKKIRDFVSHASCERKQIVDFISEKLPSAYVVGSKKPSARFDRSVEHRNFIARYEVASREIAKRLVKLSINQYSTEVTGFHYSFF